MEIINEIKAKVFAQYFAQNVGYTYDKRIESISCTNIAIIDYLILKPLSAITDEDAIEVAKIVFSEDKSYWTISQGKACIKQFGKNSPFVSFNQGVLCSQFLQSRGYDLPQYLLGGKTLQEAGLAIYE